MRRSNWCCPDPVGAEIGDGTGVATIQDNDALPSRSVADVTVGEGDGVASVTVARTGDLSGASSVNFLTYIPLGGQSGADR